MTALNPAGYVLDAGDGEHIWFSGTLICEGRRRANARWVHAHRGFDSTKVCCANPHPRRRGSGFLYRRGAVAGFLRRTDLDNGPGDFVTPRGIPHTCSTLGHGSVRLLQIT